MKPVRTLSLESVDGPGLRHQVTVSDAELVEVRRVPQEAYGPIARLLSFRYGFGLSRFQLVQAVAAGGEVYSASPAGSAVTVPSADAVRLIGSTNSALQNLGGTLALIGSAVPRVQDDPLGDEEGLRLASRRLAGPRSAEQEQWDHLEIAEEIKGFYYGYKRTDSAARRFAALESAVRADAQRFLQVLNGVLFELGNQRLVVFVPDHYPVGRAVPGALAGVARNLAQDTLDYRLRKRGFRLTGEWGFFEGPGVDPTAVSRIYLRG